jgi:hypothetical protein
MAMTYKQSFQVIKWCLVAFAAIMALVFISTILSESLVESREIPELQELLADGKAARAIARAREMDSLAKRSEPLAKFIEVNIHPLEIAHLETELKTIPASERIENLSRYQRLLELRPDNERYLAKVARYSILTDKEKAEAQFSPWDGSHRQLKDIIKDGLNDDDSFEHIETRYFLNGQRLSVHMRYRAANAFGAKIQALAVADFSTDGALLQLKQRQ